MTVFHGFSLSLKVLHYVSFWRSTCYCMHVYSDYGLIKCNLMNIIYHMYVFNYLYVFICRMIYWNLNLCVNVRIVRGNSILYVYSTCQKSGLVDIYVTDVSKQEVRNVKKIDTRHPVSWLFCLVIVCTTVELLFSKFRLHLAWLSATRHSLANILVSKLEAACRLIMLMA